MISFNMKRYKAFTLVELLIVMGILIILMALGILIGRFAIQRSNDLAHKDAVEKLYKTMLEYKSDNGQYPRTGTCTSCVEREYFAETLGYIGEKNYLEKYLDNGEFDGGTDATYYVSIDPVDAQFTVVCVSLGGIDDDRDRGYYCVGDGLGFLPSGNPIMNSDITPENSGAVESMAEYASDWILNRGFAAR